MKANKQAAGRPPEARQRRVSGEGVELAVSEWGDPAEPTVLLVHGYPDNQRVWNGVIARLAERHHVVAYDVRGAGESGRPSRAADYRLELLAADLLAVAQATAGGKRVHLVGHDWGSMQGWELVGRSGMAAQFASFTSISGPSLDHVGLWLHEGLAAGDWRAMQPLLKQALHSWYMAAMHLPLLAPLLWRAGFGRVWPALLSRLEQAEAEAGDERGRDGADGVRLYRANLLHRLLRPRECRVELPVQVLIAHDDLFVSAAFMAALLQRAAPLVPRLARYTLRGGHWLPLSQPEAVAKRIAAFVAETGASRA